MARTSEVAVHSIKRGLSHVLQSLGTGAFGQTIDASPEAINPTNLMTYLGVLEQRAHEITLTYLDHCRRKTKEEMLRRRRSVVRIPGENGPDADPLMRNVMKRMMAQRERARVEGLMDDDASEKTKFLSRSGGRQLTSMGMGIDADVKMFEQEATDMVMRAEPVLSEQPRKQRGALKLAYESVAARDHIPTAVDPAAQARAAAAVAAAKARKDAENQRLGHRFKKKGKRHGEQLGAAKEGEEAVEDVRSLAVVGMLVGEPDVTDLPESMADMRKNMHARVDETLEKKRNPPPISHHDSMAIMFGAGGNKGGGGDKDSLSSGGGSRILSKRGGRIKRRGSTGSNQQLKRSGSMANMQADITKARKDANRRGSGMLSKMLQ